MTGSEISLGEVIEEVLRDFPFYIDSGGGVTFSGGEPLMQSVFVAAALKACRENGIHTAVDTAGNVPYSAFEAVIPYTDLFLFDVKTIDTGVHREFTGAGNTLILENLLKLSEVGIPLRIRIPVIPGVNESTNAMNDIAGFLSELNNVEAVEPLAYHSLGAGKLESMGKSGEEKVFSVPNKDTLLEIYELFEKTGFRVIRKPL